MRVLPEVHPLNAELWMPDFYRRLGFYFTESGYPDVPLLEPPSSTFPKIPRVILEDIVERVIVVRYENGRLVQAPKLDPIKQTFQFGEAIGDIDIDELNLCRRSLFRTVHTNSYYFKPSIEEIALQVPPEIWGATKFVQCDRAFVSGEPHDWPRHSLVNPETGEAIRPERLHLALTCLYLEPTSSNQPGLEPSSTLEFLDK